MTMPCISAAFSKKHITFRQLNTEKDIPTKKNFKYRQTNGLSQPIRFFAVITSLKSLDIMENKEMLSFKTPAHEPTIIS